jgi:hypothetical protein
LKLPSAWMICASISPCFFLPNFNNHLVKPNYWPTIRKLFCHDFFLTSFLGGEPGLSQVYIEILQDSLLLNGGPCNPP